MKKTKIFKNIAIGSLTVFAASQVAMFQFLLQYALNGKWNPPELPQKPKKTEKQLEWDRQGEEDSKWLLSLPMEKVNVKSFDGLNLVGHYIKASESKRLVIMFHGWRGTWEGDFGSIGKWLLSIGSDLPLVEQRGQGESDGKYMGFGILERRDVDSWIKYITEERKSTIPVYLAGVSMGAATVLMASSNAMPDLVKGIIADCGFTTPYDMLKTFGKAAFNMNEHPNMDILNFLVKKKAGYDLRDYSTLTAVKQTKIPIFFVHGTADDFVPCYMSEENYNDCVSQKHLLLVEGAGHCQSFLADKERYTKEVSEFFGWINNITLTDG